MAQLSNTKNLKILEALPDKKSKAAFFSGGRATVGRITQVLDRSLVHKYVGKVRGIIIENSAGQHAFETEAEAKEAADSYLANCKTEATT